MKKIIAAICIFFAFACITAQAYKLNYYQEFDKDGNLIHEIDAYGYEYELKYDRNGNTTYCKESQNGEMIAEGWLTYYKDGSVKTKTLKDSEGYSVTYKYDKSGNVNYLEDSDGTIYRYYFDKTGRTIFANSSTGETVFFAYTDDAVYARYTSADKVVTNYTYDTFGNIVSIRYPDGTVEDYADDEYADYDEYDDYDEYEDDYYYDYDYEEWYNSLNSMYDNDEDYDDEYYEERDSHGNVTLIRTKYYSEKYEYTYHLNGEIKSMACYEDESY